MIQPYTYPEAGDPASRSLARGAIKLARPDAAHRLAARIRDPHRHKASAMLTAARIESPELVKVAETHAELKRAVNPPVAWVEGKNAKIISMSIGSPDMLMRDADVTALVKEISNGIPVFEPAVFLFTPTGPLEFSFFPAYAIELGNGGPLPAGTRFRWAASFVQAAVSALTGKPGVQARLLIEFGPAPMPGSSMSILFKTGDTLSPTELTPVHGAQAGGLARLQTSDLVATAGIPVPGVDFPRVRIIGLSTADYELQYRFMVPGDLPTDRFTAYMR